MKSTNPYHLTMAAALLIGCGVSSANAAAITDASFFTAIPHTLVTFEVNGGGGPVVLGNGASQTMPAGEYAAQGFTFSRDIHWVNDGSADFDAAQLIGGSPSTSMFYQLGNPPGNDYFLNFTVPVRAFGFWVIHYNGEAFQPTFAAFNSGGQLIDQVTFGPLFRDGSIGFADYGFMGIAANEDIASVRIQQSFTEFDNLNFSPVPEPGTSALFGLVGVSLLACTRMTLRKSGVCGRCP